jgi:hypothetical protein
MVLFPAVFVLVIVLQTSKVARGHGFSGRSGKGDSFHVLPRHVRIEMSKEIMAGGFVPFKRTTKIS